jgi:hypothetical protein
MSSIDGMTPLERTHSENASADSGVDLPPDLYEGGLMIRSTSFPEAVAARQVRHICFEVLASNSTLLEGHPPTAAACTRGLDARGWNPKAVRSARTGRGDGSNKAKSRRG